MDCPKRRGQHRIKVEKDIIRRRERDFAHQQMWNGANQYFNHWNKVNTKYEEWTSPRYYEDQNKLVTDLKTKKETSEKLENRREKLRKLLEEEKRTYEIEMMVHKCKKVTSGTVKSKPDEIPTEVLRDINVGLKHREEERRRKEAEMKLYQHWRINNPIVRQYESKFKMKDLKLSWLDQQIEKRMQKEREQEECARIIKERDEMIKRDKENEDRRKQEFEQNEQRLKKELDTQVEELKKKQELRDVLIRQEQEELQRKIVLEEIEEKHKEEEKRKLERECALFNIKQHKLKLKKKAADIEQNLATEKQMILKLKQLEIQDAIEDDKKRTEFKQGLSEFLRVVQEQQELEKQRQKHLEFLFDSEAKMMYERQMEIWTREEQSRQRLLKDVMNTLKKQVEDNLEKNKEKQKEVLKEKEELIARIEDYDKEMEKLKEQQELKKKDISKSIQEDIKVKSAIKKQQENMRLKEIDEELERIKLEEERLQKEILAIQKRQGPVRHPRSRMFY